MDAKRELSLDELDQVVGGSSGYVPREEHVQKGTYQHDRILRGFCPQCENHVAPVGYIFCDHCEIRWIVDD